MVGGLASLEELNSWVFSAVRLCLGLFPVVPAFLSSRFISSLLLLLLCLFLPLASPLLLPYARYTVWDSHLVHGIHHLTPFHHTHHVLSTQPLPPVHPTPLNTSVLRFIPGAAGIARGSSSRTDAPARAALQSDYRAGSNTLHYRSLATLVLTNDALLLI